MKFILKSEYKEVESEVEVELWLEEMSNGDIWLRAKNGKASKDILKLRGGKFIRFKNAQLNGIETDKEGRILEEK